MDKQLLIDKINGIQNPVKEKQTIYEVLTALNIPFKKTSCSRCINDLLNICKEELGLIGNAAEVSDFNGAEQTETGEKTRKWVYIADRPQTWNGHVINNDTPEEVIAEFVKKHPNGYYKLVAE